MSNHVFVDFDETLFNHRKFAVWLDNYFFAQNVIKQGELLNSFEKYHDVQDISGILRLYRHEDHINDVTGHDWLSIKKGIIERVRSENVHFCYDDAHDFLRLLLRQKLSAVKILSYGNPEYQLFKIKLCDLASELPITIVTEHKARYLQKNFGHSSVVGALVDDKAPLNLPANWRHLWLNRGKEHNQNLKTAIEVANLEHAGEILFKEKLVQYS